MSQRLRQLGEVILRLRESLKDQSFTDSKLKLTFNTLNKSKTSNQKPVDIRLKYTFLNFDPKTSN